MTDKQIRMLRATKLSLAALLLCLSIWALFLPPMFPASTRSLINARAVTLLSRDAGTVERVLARERQAVASGTLLMELGRNQRQLERERLTLAAEREKVAARGAETRRNLAVEQERLQEKNHRLGEWLGSALVLQESRLKHLEELIEIGKGEVALQEQNNARLAPLLDEGIITAHQWGQAQEKQLALRRDLAQNQNDVQEIRATVSRMRAGESNPDQTGVETLRNEIRDHERQVSALTLEVSDLSIEENKLSRQAEENALRLREDRAATVASPVNGLVWRQFAIQGESVQEGDPLLQIADVDRLFVEALVGRQYLESIALGDHAHILIISQRRFIQGTVREIQSQEEGRTVETAIQTVAPDASMLRVLIELAPGQVTHGDIGQITKVMMSKGKPGPFTRAMVWLSYVIRSDR